MTTKFNQGWAASPLIYADEAMTFTPRGDVMIMTIHSGGNEIPVAVPRAAFVQGFAKSRRAMQDWFGEQQPDAELIDFRKEQKARRKRISR